MTRAIDLLERSATLLLDFDGPVCKVFTGVDLAQAVRGVAEALEFAPSASPTGGPGSDPLELLRWVGQEAPTRLPQAEELVTSLEVEGATASAPTSGIAEVLMGCERRRQPVAIVSNNSEQSVRAFVQQHGGVFEGIPIIGRAPCRPDLMKPDPDPLRRASDLLNSPLDHCVLLGDSVSDVEAARRAGARSIAFVNKARKEAALRRASPDATVHHLKELVAKPTG